MFVLCNRLYCKKVHQWSSIFTSGMWKVYIHLCLCQEWKMLVYEVPNKTDIHTVLREQLFMYCCIFNKVQIIITHLKYITILITFTNTTGLCILWLMCRSAFVIY
jgi:hypothetical protein